MPPKRYQQPKKSRVELEITTAQKVMVGVALLASIGAFAAGFAAIPNANCNKGDKNCFAKSGQQTSLRTMQRTTQVTTQIKTAPMLPYKSVTVSAITKIRPGTLVMSTTADVTQDAVVYYFASDKKLYQFENGNGGDSKFAVLQWMPLVGNKSTIYKLPIEVINQNLGAKKIWYRPGTLIKPTNAAVVLYVCEADTICKVSDETAAKNVAGADWASKVISADTTKFPATLKKLMTIYASTDVSQYSQSYLETKYSSIEKYLGL